MTFDRNHKYEMATAKMFLAGVLAFFAVVAALAFFVSRERIAESRAKAIAACTAHHPPAECEKLWEATR